MILSDFWAALGKSAAVAGLQAAAQHVADQREAVVTSLATELDAILPEAVPTAFRQLEPTAISWGLDLVLGKAGAIFPALVQDATEELAPSPEPFPLAPTSPPPPFPADAPAPAPEVPNG